MVIVYVVDDPGPGVVEFEGTVEQALVSVSTAVDVSVLMTTCQR
jgi:hypothetical protein